MDFGVGRDAAGARGPHTLACAVERQTVIAAFQRIALDAPFGQGQLSVRAGIFEPDQFSGFGAEYADLFTKHDDLLQLTGDLMIPGCDVPSVLQKHRLVLSVHRRKVSAEFRLFLKSPKNE